MAREIKLNGREQTMMRTIGFGLGISGAEIQERMAMAHDELVDILNSLMDMGFIETASMRERVTMADYGKESFEVNPSYATDLRQAMRRN